MLFLTQSHTYHMTSADKSLLEVCGLLSWCVYVLFLILKLQSQFNCNLPINYQDFSFCVSSFSPLPLSPSLAPKSQKHSSGKNRQPATGSACRDFFLLSVTMRYSGTNVSVPRQCTTAVQLSHFQLSPILPNAFSPSLQAQHKCFSFNDPFFQHVVLRIRF